MSVAKARQAISEGKYVRAEEILAKVNADDRTRSADSIILQAKTLAKCEKYLQAVDLLESYASGITDPRVNTRLLVLSSDILCSRTKVTNAEIARAIAFLERAIALGSDTDRLIVRKNLCGLCTRLGKFEAVYGHAKELITHPRFRNLALLWLAMSCLYSHRRAEGRKYLSEAMKNAQDLSDSEITWLLDILIDYRLRDEAENIIENALRKGRSRYCVLTAEARICYENGDYEQVINLLSEEVLNKADEEFEERQLRHSLKGRSLDALGRYDEAHCCFDRMNDIAKSDSMLVEGKDFVRAYGSMDLNLIVNSEMGQENIPEMVFMIGFPRSGTTLLDSILDTHSDISILSETNCLTSAMLKMSALGRNYPEDLSRLTNDELQEIREEYLSTAKKILDPDDDSRILIDKLPLNIQHLPFISLIFPQAKYILSLRHPIDVCLSCYQQSFKLNQEMIHFTGIEPTFRRYKEVMELFLRFEKTRRLNVFQVKYEELITCFEQTIRDVFEFLELSPSAEFRRFHELNRDKASVTPSRDQITRPIYNSSINRWKNYNIYLEEYIPIIAPLINRFDYEVG